MRIRNCVFLLTGIVLAAYLVLLARGHSRTHGDRPERELSAS